MWNQVEALHHIEPANILRTTPLLMELDYANVSAPGVTAGTVGSAAGHARHFHRRTVEPNPVHDSKEPPLWLKYIIQRTLGVDLLTGEPTNKKIKEIPTLLV